MCIGEQLAVICLESIAESDRKLMTGSLQGRDIISISFEQMECFAGNMLALKTNDNQSILVLSQTAYDSLTDTQRNELNKYAELVPVKINMIETIGGGSARCMIGEIFLKGK